MYNNKSQQPSMMGTLITKGSSDSDALSRSYLTSINSFSENIFYNFHIMCKYTNK